MKQIKWLAAALILLSLSLLLRLFAGLKLSPLWDLFLLSTWAVMAIAIVCQLFNALRDESNNE